MTSRKSYSKVLRIALKNHLWSIALSCVSLFISLPIYAALNISIIESEFASGIIKREVLARLFAENVMGEGNVLLIITTIFLAIIIALNGFSYLFSKEKVDLYHSVPVKRDALFVINYITGLITYIIPYIFFMLLMVIVAQARGYLSANGIVSMLIMLLINILGYIGIYSITVLAIMLTGNTIVSLLATATFLLYTICVLGLVTFCNGLFFYTYANESFDQTFSRVFSPISEYVGLINGLDTFHEIHTLNALRIIEFIICVAVIIAINFVLYRLRPSEAAGHSITFNKSRSIISIAILVPVSIFGSIAFNSIARSDRMVSYGWMIFGAAFALIIGHFIIQAIFYRDFSALLKDMINPLISAVIVAIILCIYCFDLIHYDSYNPSDSAKLDSISVSTYGLQGYMDYYDFDAPEDQYGNKYYYVDLSKYRLEHVKITDRQLIDDFISTAISESKYHHDYTLAHPDDDNYYNNTATTEFTIAFNFANGKTVYRRYVIDLLTNMDLYDRLYRSAEYKEGVFTILGLEDEDVSNIRFANAAGDIESSMTKEQMIKLVNTYKEELLKQDAYELESHYPVGYIYQNYAIYENGHVSNYMLHKSFIYPSFVKTLALLDEYGIDVNKYLTIDNIESIRVSNYFYDGGQPILYDTADEFFVDDTAMETDVMSEEMTKEYTSREDIAAILEFAVPSDMLNADSTFKRTADLDVQVSLKESPNSYSYPLQYYIPVGRVPSFVQVDVGYADAR